MIERGDKGAAPGAAPGVGLRPASASDDDTGPAVARSGVGPLLVGLVATMAGAFLLWEALAAVDDGGLTVDGPRLAPIIVSTGWLVLSVGYLGAAVVSVPRNHVPTQRAGVAPDRTVPGTSNDEMEIHRFRPAALVAVMVAYAMLLEPAGFVLATVAFFVAAAWLLGSRRAVRDIAVAVGLSLATYLAFTRVLEIHLPEGLLPL